MMHTLYTRILKPIFFKFDPEDIHNLLVDFGEFLGNFKLTKLIIKKLFNYDNSKLKQEVAGIHFRNPIGLAAGFDYNARLTNILADVGFSFESAGTVTYSPYEGNPKPRLARLPDSQGLLVNKGFKSAGIKEVLNKYLHTIDNDLSVGISLGATNSPNCSTPQAQILDIVNSAKYLKTHPVLERLSYVELNISCPNVLGSGSLAQPEYLTELLTKINEVNLCKPIFVKFQLEIEWDLAKKLIQIMVDHGVSAIVIANLLKKRDEKYIAPKDLEKISTLKGNISGKPTFIKSNDLIRETYKEFGGKIKIIGLGGVFNTQDAYTKIKLGATLIQLITGMIYEGPQLIGDINRELIKLLEKDGYSNISQAIGVDAK